MRIAVFGLIVSLLAVACTGSPTPSIDLRDLKAVVEADDHILVGFSTDQLSRSEAQEVMLLAAALVARERGGDLFQFRSVSAKGLVDEQTGKIRYFDIRAVVDPLQPGETGDEVRKTYRAEGVIGFLAPKYRPLLPSTLMGRLGKDSSRDESGSAT